VPTPEALDLVAYLKALDHTYAALALPDGATGKTNK
jgi:cytochrome c oxidase cbb3-type subunit 2